MSDRLLRGKSIEAMIALIGWVSAQILPGPIGIADIAEILVIAKLGGPVRPHVESSTRHTTPRTPCSMGLRALRRLSLGCSIL
jgi:hypothetical protein